MEDLGRRVPDRKGGDDERLAIPQPDEDWMRGYPQEMEDFVDAVREGREPLSAPPRARDGRGHLCRVRVGARGRRVELKR